MGFLVSLMHQRRLCGQVRPSEGKGNGAFATKLILADTFLGDYEGELLDEVAYWQRYPTGVVSQPTKCAINELLPCIIPTE